MLTQSLEHWGCKRQLATFATGLFALLAVLDDLLDLPALLGLGVRGPSRKDALGRYRPVTFKATANWRLSPSARATSGHRGSRFWVRSQPRGGGF